MPYCTFRYVILHNQLSFECCFILHSEKAPVHQQFLSMLLVRVPLPSRIAEGPLSSVVGWCPVRPARPLALPPEN
jgi:hypothetical protein